MPGIEDGTEQISRDLLGAIPVDYAAERANVAAQNAATRTWVGA
ncbi:hypothetical protein [Nonomuraea sp. NPDC049709]